MKIFNETVNKYYEYLSYLVNYDESYTEEQLKNRIINEICGDFDNIVFCSLFPKEEDNDYIFSYEDNTFSRSLEKDLPIRCNIIELQALRNIIDNEYAKVFLSSKSIEKIEKISPNNDWNLSDIIIRNRNKKIVTKTEEEYRQIIMTIIEAVSSEKCIEYNNVKEGQYEYIGCLALPIKLEYSLINDMFRLWAYDIDNKKIFKMNIDTMSDVRVDSKKTKDIIEKYNEAMRDNMKELTIRVNAKEYIVERCFRNFSYYERISSYDKENEVYELNIKYHILDEAEIIRDIMSLGSSVIIMEPKDFREKIYKRIRMAKELYE